MRADTAWPLMTSDTALGVTLRRRAMAALLVLDFCMSFDICGVHGVV